MFTDIKLRQVGAPGELWLGPSVQELVFQFRQTGALDKEAGGILLGHRRGCHIEVLEGSAPMAGDIRRRNSFERKDPDHQAVSDDRWKASNGTITYLGEWHTHPAEMPTPSPTDEIEWGKLGKFYRDPLVFLIAGTDRWYVELNRSKWLINFRCSPDSVLTVLTTG